MLLLKLSQQSGKTLVLQLGLQHTFQHAAILLRIEPAGKT